MAHRGHLNMARISIRIILIETKEERIERSLDGDRTPNRFDYEPT